MKIKNLNNLSQESLNQKLLEFLDSLLKTNKEFHYFPVKEGYTNEGEQLTLGFSCFALKIYFTINEWDSLGDDVKGRWGNFINSFQTKDNVYLPSNSYIDQDYLKHFNRTIIKSSHKEAIKRVLNLHPRYNFELKRNQFESFIRAETKQAIATLKQVNLEQKAIYSDFPQTKDSIFQYLDTFNWQKPWSAGAQFSGLCVFSKTQLEKNSEAVKSLESYIDSKVNISDGFYYEHKTPNLTELVNGTMKVLTGIDWLDMPIHYPEKIIDTCLENQPTDEGCDLVDYVYVLYRCSLETNYKKKEVVSYLENFLNIIFKHYFQNSGGFSYSINESQKLYYGVTISKGKSEADIHGTVLLTWAISMILEITENSDYNWNVLKP